MAGDVALVADIGRQSVRFGLTGGDAGMMPRDVRKYMTAEHPTFTSALVAYLSGVGMQEARLPSVLAVAGAVRGDLINLTGSRWYISLSGVEAVLRSRPRALNECAANALALTMLPVSAFTPLQGPTPRLVETGGNYLVIGTGTGLGVAALVTSNGRLGAIQTEAGHMSFAASTADERKFADHCTARGLPFDVETLLSAPGLLLAYEALSGGRKLDKPEDVTRNVGRDPVSTAVVRMFVEHLGSFAGDLALAYGAWDGVFLTGAIARALHPQLMDPGFRRRLEGKAAFRRQLSEVPVALVNRTDLELLGAAAALGNA
ncbi:glucokinase [Sphingomonas naasensis]|uniref:ROK family protein n=1 Tax=Sphingomonas naasensis TaxID=1344951 RepID=A0A4S1WLP6_9SPHN|nr:ROK family protein [Sphingomonas naasensis]NIJ20971.1 glucokinase [Sphingomonas naasensis]TGX43355.1 ROK family protein [Sphingomonas naasensis]